MPTTLWDDIKALEARIEETLSIPEYLFLTEVFDVTDPDVKHQVVDALRFFRKGYESGWDDARMTFDTEG